MRVGFGAVGAAVLWRCVHVEMGMYLCIGMMSLCRSFRRQVLDKRSRAMFEPLGAGLGDWCVRVRVIGKDFTPLSRVPSHAPKSLWASHRGGGWGTLWGWPDSVCVRGADGVFKNERARRGLCWEGLSCRGGEGSVVFIPLKLLLGCCLQGFDQGAFISYSL